MINVADMLKVFNEYRGDAIVVPGQGGRHWISISTRPNLDVPLIPYPAMGGGASFAFGLALAQPARKVVVFDSEGSLLMNLGVLPTVAEQRPKNFYHFLLDNECYATTGGQPVPNAGRNSYDMLARGVGYSSVHSFDNLETFATHVERILSASGPVFVWLKVVPEVQNLPGSAGAGRRAPANKCARICSASSAFHRRKISRRGIQSQSPIPLLHCSGIPIWRMSFAYLSICDLTYASISSGSSVTTE